MLLDPNSDIVALGDWLTNEADHGPAPDHLLLLAERAGVLELLAARPEVRAQSRHTLETFMSQAAIGALRLAELRRIAEALSEHDIIAVPLKGMAYALMFESGGPTRAMADMDILVYPDHFDSACFILVQLGYSERKDALVADAPGYHERVFVKDGLVVEIHRSFLAGQRVVVDYPALWRRTRQGSDECPQCRLLGPEDTFLYHCFHMGMHEFQHGLRPLVELRRLILLDRPKLPVCVARACSWGTLRMTWCALKLLRAVFPESLEHADVERFAPALPVRMALERWVIEPSLELLEMPEPLPRHAQLMRKALLVERYAGAMEYGIWWGKERAKKALKRQL